ncbi:MAG TPA: hypothetical protein VFQ61_21830 [Polyangiaceae bacterium]|nr:hypothetical protein [Polyangiaceae bacterium]
MPTLSSNIVKRDIASVHDVEKALARQALYGGDLPTNLLEVAAVSEADLTRIIAETSGLQSAPVGELPRAEDAVLSTIASSVAQRYGLYPLSKEGNALRVAVSEPLLPAIVAELEFSLGVKLVQQATTRVRVEQAIARDYGLELNRRVARVLAKVEGDRDPYPTMPPETAASRDPSFELGTESLREASTKVAPPRTAAPETTTGIVPPSLSSPPASLLETPSSEAFSPEPPQSEVISLPGVAPSSGGAPQSTLTVRDTTNTVSDAFVGSARNSSGASRSGPDSRDSAPPGPRSGPTRAGETLRSSRPPPKLDTRTLTGSNLSQRRRRRLGPYTLAMAERDLAEAISRDDVVRTFFDFASQYFEYAALFAVHRDLAEGRDAHGSGAPREKVLAIGVPLDLPSTFAQVIGSESYRITRLSPTGIDGALAKDLERRPGPSTLILAIRVRGRSVLALYGDHGDQDVELPLIGDVIAFAPLVQTALERIIRLRKDRARPASAPPAAVAEVPAASADSPESAVPNTVQEQLPSPVNGTSSDVQATLPSEPPTRSHSLPPLPMISVGGARPEAPRASVVPAVLTPSQVPPRVSVLPLPSLSRTPVPSSLAPGAPPQASSNAVAVANTEPHLSAAEIARAAEPEPVGIPETLRGPSMVPPPLPEDAFSAVEAPTVTGSWDSDTEESADLGSRAFALSPRTPPAAQATEELQLPTVIVDLAHDTEELVGRMLEGDEAAAVRLVQMGTAAVPALVGAFPGPITSELRRGAGDGPPRASECGPLLKVLARIGHKAAPILAVRSNDRSPAVRAWATRLLGEMPCMDAARAIGRRFVDEDPDVRRAALAAGRMLQAHPGANAVLAATLSEMLLDPAGEEHLEHMVIEAIADLREPRPIPSLIQKLAHGSSDVQRSAQWALVVLTRTDFGTDTAAWTRWWEHNGSRHRIEWLIDALMHETPELRRSAGDELKSLTKEYFGYYDELPPRERERAQQRYRAWWESKGKDRFSVIP